MCKIDSNSAFAQSSDLWATVCKHMVVLQQVPCKCDDTHLKCQHLEGWSRKAMSSGLALSTQTQPGHTEHNPLSQHRKGLGVQLNWECLPSMHEALLNSSTVQNEYRSDTSPQTYYYSRRKGRRIRNLRPPLATVRFTSSLRVAWETWDFVSKQNKTSDKQKAKRQS